MNAASSTAEAVITGQGVFLAGEVFSVDQGKPYKKRDGTDVEPTVVAVAVGSQLIRIDYESEALAQDALGGAVKGDYVVLPVFANGPWDAERGRSAPVSFRAR